MVGKLPKIQYSQLGVNSNWRILLLKSKSDAEHPTGSQIAPELWLTCYRKQKQFSELYTT